MRTVSLINRLKWSFSGNMNPHALVLGDADNDSDMEFVIGNLHGKLAVFKGECPSGTPTFVCEDLGTITCITVGDVRNIGKNSIVLVNAEGHCYIFDLPPAGDIQQQQQQQQQQQARDDLLARRRPSDATSLQHFRRLMHHNDDTHDTADGLLPVAIQPSLSLMVPINVNKILIADVDGDGMNEMVLARTDRILHAFLLEHVTSGTISPAPTHPTAPNSPSTATTFTSTIQSSLSALSAHKLGSKVFKTSASRAKVASSKTEVVLREKGMWVFDGQITSLTVSHVPDKPEEPILLVAQPGNTFTIIDRHGQRLNADFTPQTPAASAQPSNTGTTTTTATESSTSPTADTANTANNDTTNDEQDTISRLHTVRALLQDENMSMTTSSQQLQSAAVEKQIQVIPIDDLDRPYPEIKRTCYLVQDFEPVTGDNSAVKQEKHTAVATEIVIGRMHDIDSPEAGRHVGMLSMDGHFTIYDLKTKKTTSQDLLVSHKLFSLANLDVKHGAPLPTRRAPSRSPSQTASPAISRHYPHYTTPATGSPASSKAQATTAATTTTATSLHTPGNNGNTTSGGANATTTGGAGSTSSRSPSLSSLKRSRVSITSSPAIADDDGGRLSATNSNNAGTGASITWEPRERLPSISLRRSSTVSATSSVSWSDVDDTEEVMGSLDRDLFVVCAWNGVTYLIDWSQPLNDDDDDDVDDESPSNASPDTNASPEAHDPTAMPNNLKYPVVKFAFDGRVCAFTAGMYAVLPGYNVPCLFYVDFEDQIFVYYDVHIRPGSVHGFLDVLDDDVDEAMDRWMGLELELDQMDEPRDQDDPAAAVDLGDGWKGFMGKEIVADDDQSIPNLHDADMAEIIHNCLYEFDDMKDQLEQELFMFEQEHLHANPSHADIRRLSDLNITIEPPTVESELAMDDAHADDDNTSIVSTPSSASTLSNDSDIRQWVNENLLS